MFQVFQCLNRLNICLSFQGMLNIVKGVSEFHDVEVQCWSDSIKECFLKKQQVSQISRPSIKYYCYVIKEEEPTESTQLRLYCNRPSAISLEMLLDEDEASSSPDEDEATSRESARSAADGTSSSSESGSDEASTPSAPAYSPVSTVVSTSSSAQSITTEDDQPEHQSPGEENVEISVEADVSVERVQSTWDGFKIVGDNVDKNVRPSFQRQEHQTRSLHHFHAYAVRDRVSCSSLSDNPKAEPSPTSINVDIFLMTPQEWDHFKEDCSILITR